MTWDDHFFSWRLKQKLEWNLQTSQLLFWFVWINCFFVANQLMDCFGSFFPQCFQKKTKALVLFPPPKKNKGAGNIFFQLNLYRCFVVVPHHEKIHLVIQRFLPKACVLQDYGRYVFGEGLPEVMICFFLGVTFHVSSPLDVYYIIQKHMWYEVNTWINE